MDQRSTQAKKEIIMRTHGHTTVWGIHLGLGRANDAKSWYKQLKEWRAAREAMRHERKIAALTARWDAKREAVRPLHADAAADMVTAPYARSTITALCALGI